MLDDEFDTEAQLLRLRDFIEANSDKIEEALKTDKIESRISFLEQELKKYDWLLIQTESIDTLTYEKRVILGPKLSCITASVKHDQDRLKSDLFIHKLRSKSCLKLNSANFMDIVQNNAYMDEMRRMLDEHSSRLFNTADVTKLLEEAEKSLTH